MATTYGYGGEFSSDEDVDKLEQMQNDRMVQSKFDGNPRPSKKQIEDLIEAIKKMPIEQEVNLADDMLAGLLDHYKTQRGPIVESTRKLYHKIALRLIRGDQSQVVVTNSATPKDTNGNLNSNNNVIQDNNNSINIASKGPQQKADTFSSDEDEEVSFVNRRATQQNENESKMDVDSVTPTGPPRVTKQVDISSTDEDDDTSQSSNDDDTSELEELHSESDVMDVTPIKPPADQQKANKEKEGIEAVLAAARVTPRQPEYSAKRQPLAQSTPKDGPDTAKKPYTRSQRVATRSATRGMPATESSAKSLSQASVSSDAFIKKQGSSKKYVLIAASVLVAVLAFLAYYFRSFISESTAPFLAPKIKF